MDTDTKLPSMIDFIKIRDKCPHCKAYAHFTLITYSNYKTNNDYAGSIYCCSACSGIIFIKWRIAGRPSQDTISVDSPEYSHLNIPDADLKYVPEDIKKEYSEALKCYGISCYNAFASMCRRTIQAIFMEKGIEGTSKITKQFESFKEENNDPDVLSIIDELIKTGNDGAHPQLPEVSSDRAELLLNLMNDTLDQIYNRPGRLKDSKLLREKAINEKKA